VSAAAGWSGARSVFPSLLIFAALLAGLELLFAIGPGHFIARGRIELDAFLAIRPWLMLGYALGAVVLVGARPWPVLAGLALTLLLATGCEALLLAALSDPAVPPEIPHIPAFIASLGLGLVLLAAVWLFHRLAGQTSTSRAFAFVTALIFGLGLLALRPPLPSPVGLFERVARGPAVPLPGREGAPRVGLLTGLPLRWGDGDAAATLAGDRTAPQLYRALDAQFPLTVLDSLSPETLAGIDVLMLAQPRPLAPVELVVLDDWLRAGGAALIFTDPDLRWPSALAPSDRRRPPHRQTLAPLLAHWGLRLDPAGDEIAFARVPGYAPLPMVRPGRFERVSGSCAVSGDGFIARCATGRGGALLSADADLLQDQLLTGGVDTARFVADSLDRLGGDKEGRRGQRQRALHSYPFAKPVSPSRLALAVLPLLLAFIAAASWRKRLIRG